MTVYYSDKHPDPEVKLWVGCTDCARSASFPTRVITLAEGCALLLVPKAPRRLWCDNCSVELHDGVADEDHEAERSLQEPERLTAARARGTCPRCGGELTRPFPRVVDPDPRWGCGACGWEEGSDAQTAKKKESLR